MPRKNPSTPMLGTRSINFTPPLIEFGPGDSPSESWVFIFHDEALTRVMKRGCECPNSQIPYAIKYFGCLIFISPPRLFSPPPRVTILEHLFHSPDMGT
ncbi:hypothetical protein TNIN_281131 [Trichonephila inaurata madagascariensis]|uniref:Uncharacterized protein n=1 Tax=Trichonephila inaurata madagascariensis TaxID=2747483 RepID=A0A8X7CSS2_9ARAC|nr:hypothetical protein TNIN_281131 [Trichonephila inaurata madagascariensis]